MLSKKVGHWVRFEKEKHSEKTKGKILKIGQNDFLYKSPNLFETSHVRQKSRPLGQIENKTNIGYLSKSYDSSSSPFYLKRSDNTI